MHIQIIKCYNSDTKIVKIWVIHATFSKLSECSSIQMRKLNILHVIWQYLRGASRTQKNLYRRIRGKKNSVDYCTNLRHSNHLQWPSKIQSCILWAEQGMVNSWAKKNWSWLPMMSLSRVHFYKIAFPTNMLLVCSSNSEKSLTGSMHLPRPAFQ